MRAVCLVRESTQTRTVLEGLYMGVHFLSFMDIYVPTRENYKYGRHLPCCYALLFLLAKSLRIIRRLREWDGQDAIEMDIARAVVMQQLVQLDWPFHE